MAPSDMSPQRMMKRSGSLPSMREVQQEVADDGGDTVQVYVRVRPMNKREQTQARSDAPVVIVEPATSSVVLQVAPPRRFRFDGVRGEEATQEDLFELVARDVGDSCLAGYNGSICVYGQTGAGKTYTMVGPVACVQSMQMDPRRGLICRVLEHVFTETQNRRVTMPSMSYTCRCSFLEIYREQITDLLDPSNIGLQLREDASRGVYVERLSEPVVDSLDEASELLLKGLQQRRTGTTHMNERSSRSHAVFTISIEMAQVCDGATSRQLVHLNLVDLAGSERQLGVADMLRSAAVPGQSMPVKEASAINRSLSALTNVIMSLSQEAKVKRRSFGASRGWPRRSFVNYRDSKLTFLLRDSLGGDSKTAIVANVSPSALCSSETLSTLKFAARAKHIQCSAVRKVDNSTSVESLLREVTFLRRRVTELESLQDHHASASSSCGRSSCGRSSCSTEEDSLVASATKHAAQEEELQPRRGSACPSEASWASVARLSETKRDLFKAISQLAQVEAKLQLATAEALDLTQEAAKLQAAGGAPVTAEAFAASLRLDASTGSCTQRASTARAGTAVACPTEPRAAQPASPKGPSPRVVWSCRSSPRLMTRQVQSSHVVWHAACSRPQSPQQSTRVLSPHAVARPQVSTPASIRLSLSPPGSPVTSPTHFASRGAASAAQLPSFGEIGTPSVVSNSPPWSPDNSPNRFPARGAWEAIGSP